MATSDRSDIELTAGNKDRIAVEPWHGRVSIFVVDGSGSVEGEAHVVMEPAECDALIAAIGRALGRPPVTPAILDLARSIADLPEEESARMVARWKEARGEQGATVPRAGVEALRDELVDFQKRYVLGGMTETRVDRIVTMVDALLAAPATQTEKG